MTDSQTHSLCQNSFPCSQSTPIAFTRTFDTLNYFGNLGDIRCYSVQQIPRKLFQSVTQAKNKFYLDVKQPPQPVHIICLRGIFQRSEHLTT